MLHCYVRYQAYCYVPPQTLMKVSCESGRVIRAEIQMFRLSPKLVRGSLQVSSGEQVKAREKNSVREQRKFDKNKKKWLSWGENFGENFDEFIIAEFF